VSFRALTVPRTCHARARTVEYFCPKICPSYSGPMQLIERCQLLGNATIQSFLDRDQEHTRYDFLTQDTVILLRKSDAYHRQYNHLLTYANIRRFSRNRGAVTVGQERKRERERAIDILFVLDYSIVPTNSFIIPL
jgi:hypothetical protein